MWAFTDGICPVPPSEKSQWRAEAEQREQRNKKNYKEETEGKGDKVTVQVARFHIITLTLLHYCIIIYITRQLASGSAGSNQ